MNHFKIIDGERATPAKVVTNDDLSKIMDTSDAWIRKRTGIKQRYIATTETTSSLACEVAGKLVKNSATNPDELDFIIVATMSADYQTPSCANEVQAAISADNAVAFDIDVACSGFAYSLAVMNKLLADKEHGKGIIIGAEVLSKYIDWSDRSCAVLFGDGAGGVLVENDPDSQSKVLSTDLHSYGKKGKSLTAGGFQYSNPFSEQSNADSQYFKMDGRSVFNFAVKKVPKSIERALGKANLTVDDIDYFIVHQANARIIQTIIRKMKIDPQKVPINIDKYGNTAAASEPILFSELLSAGRFQRGSKIVLTGFGGGLTTGTVIINY